jgi:hypothetical protein
VWSSVRGRERLLATLVQISRSSRRLLQERRSLARIATLVQISRRSPDLE